MSIMRINMSCVYLLGADRPLPCQAATRCRIRTVQGDGCVLTVEEEGFSARPHIYYRAAVEALELSMRPFLYELDLSATEEDAEQLRAYLAKNLTAGETVELWNLWVGPDREERVRCFWGTLAQLDGETLRQFCCPPPRQRELPWQCRLTIEI